MILSQHAAKRMRQRGYREEDLGLIKEVAMDTQDGLFLRRKDVSREIGRLEQERIAIRCRIEKLRRLQGTFIPMSGGIAKSIYRPGYRKGWRIRRGTRDRGIK